jgi:hypothetical protein
VFDVTARASLAAACAVMHCNQGRPASALTPVVACREEAEHECLGRGFTAHVRPMGGLLQKLDRRRKVLTAQQRQPAAVMLDDFEAIMATAIESAAVQQGLEGSQNGGEDILIVDDDTVDVATAPDVEGAVMFLHLLDCMASGARDSVACIGTVLVTTHSTMQKAVGATGVQTATPPPGPALQMQHMATGTATRMAVSASHWRQRRGARPERSGRRSV